MLLALDFRLDKPKEIVIVTPVGKKTDAALLITEFRKQYLPNRILIVSEEGSELDRLAEITPLVQSKYAIGGKATAFVCEKGFCKLPTSDAKTFAKQISVVEKLQGAP